MRSERKISATKWQVQIERKMSLKFRLVALSSLKFKNPWDKAKHNILSAKFSFNVGLGEG